MPYSHKWLNAVPCVLESQVEEHNLRNKKFKEALLRAVRNLLTAVVVAAGEWIGGKHQRITQSSNCLCSNFISAV